MHAVKALAARLMGGAFAVAVVLAGGSVHAQEGCRADLAKFCPQAKAGGGEVAACLESNKAQLSPPCKEQVAKMTELLKEVDKACAEDIHAHCPGVQPGAGRVAACLKQNLSSLSFSCKVKLAEARAAK
jgi:Cysteine rich repeat